MLRRTLTETLFLTVKNRNKQVFINSNKNKQIFSDIFIQYNIMQTFKVNKPELYILTQINVTNNMRKSTHGQMPFLKTFKTHNYIIYCLGILYPSIKEHTGLNNCKGKVGSTQVLQMYL